MRVFEKRIEYRGRSTIFKLYPLGDLHCGTTFFAERAFKEIVREVKETKNALWVGMGDYGEFITSKDPRWDVGSLAKWVKQNNVAESQRVYIRDLLMPIKDKCLGLIMGNHENVIRLRNDQDIHLDLCHDLDVPNLGYSCFYHLIFERRGSNAHHMVICHFNHGSGGAQTQGGRIMRLQREIIANRAHIYAMGHLHDIKILPLPELRSTKNREVKNQTRIAAITGCWYKAYGDCDYPSYAEVKSYAPSDIGCPIFTIQPDKMKIGCMQQDVSVILD